MKPRYLLFLVSIFATPVAQAEKLDPPTTAPSSAMGIPCDLTGYKTASVVLTPAFAIPDNSDTDALVTTVDIPDDSTEFLDVIAEVKIAHTFVGDLVLRLEYFDNCAAVAPVAMASLICRPQGTSANWPLPCGTATGGAGAGSNIGTSATNASNLPAAYLFSDAAATKIADGVNPTLTPAGCYQPTIGAMSGFANLRKGGCFKLFAADYEGADLGTIEEVHIHSLNSQNVPTRAVSWGRIKSIYR